MAQKLVQNNNISWSCGSLWTVIILCKFRLQTQKKKKKKRCSKQCNDVTTRKGS